MHVGKGITHGAARVWCQKLQGSSIWSSSSHNNGVLHGIGISQSLDDLGDSWTLLSNGDVDAVQFFLLISTIVETFLVNDGIDGNGGFAAKRNQKLLEHKVVMQYWYTKKKFQFQESHAKI